MRTSESSITTIAEIATRAGVSTTTVSRVLSASEHPVSESARRRVLEAARELDYHPSAAARALSRGRTRAVGIAVPDLANPYYTEILDLAQEQARLAGYTVLCADFRRDPQRLEEALHLFRSQRVDGVVIAGGGGRGSPDLAVLDRARIPVVVVGRYPAPAVAVRVDNVEAGRLAAHHLAARGHRSVGFISGPEELTTVEDRLLGFSQACEEASITLHVAPGDFKPYTGYLSTRRLLAKGLGVTAICAANDQMAIGAMAACADAGTVVPDEMALMGFDDIPLASFVRPALTSVAISGRNLGCEAGRLLLALIDGAEVPPVTWVDIRLVERDSTALGAAEASVSSGEMRGGIE